jgi:glucose/arabinose dehydrogenase/PKD repeat protein
MTRFGAARSTSANQQSPAVGAAATDTAAVESVASTYSAVEVAPEARAVPVVSSAPSNVLSRVASSVLAWVGLSPSASGTPLAPVESPALWAVLAWARRQNRQTLTDETPTINMTTAQSSQTVDSVVTANTTLSAPVTDDAELSALVTGDVALAAAVSPPAFVQVKAAVPQTNQSSVPVTYTGAQTAGNTNILAIGWSNATSNITSVTDAAGNTYQLAVPTARGAGVSQAIYYAKNIKAAAAGTNTVTVNFNTATPFVDIRATEYSGLDPNSPFDVGTSASGTSTLANSGTVTTTAPGLVFGAGTTSRSFTAAGTNFTTRIITTPDADIAEDRIVTAAGPYSATAPLSAASAAWVMQVAAFKAAAGNGGDTTPPTAVITAPPPGTVSGTVTLTATATDNVGVAGVQFRVDNNPLAAEDTTSPYSVSWNTTTATNGTHTLTAVARDAAGNATTSAPVTVTVANAAAPGTFENEILATGLDLPTAMKFLPDGRMLVAELGGKIKVVPPPYTQADPTPFLQLTNVGGASDGTVAQQGIYDLALDPNFATNNYYYISYTANTPNRDRLSRFTANATLTGTVPGSELIIYQDTQNANTEHHGGAITFGNDGKIYLTTGDAFLGAPSQDLTSPRGKILRFNPDGTVPTDNPFYDSAGPNYDAIWALGLRNPYRAYYDAPTGRLLIGDVGGNNAATAVEELDVGARGANYGWPNVEGTSSNPAFTNPIYSYPHLGRDASITGGFVYHGTQFPSEYQGSYFFGDYAQNTIKRLTFDANGNVNGVFNFEPANGAPDGLTGDIVYLTQGPEGALYYIDLGVADTTGQIGVSKIRRISFVGSNQPPVAQASANPTTGPTPLVVNFSSAGSSDPEGQPLTYAWNFGDNTTSTAANPTHTYTTPGPYQARLTVSDGVNSTISAPLSISAGSRPTATILSPTDGATFKAGDVITFSGSATDAEDGTLPASAYTWKVDFLHEGHVHPGTPITGVTSGTFTIPTTGHDFSGFTRYQVSLTVTDSSGLQSTSSVTVFPQKVNLNFATVPAGGTVFLDGIAHTAPFVYDTLVGFNHTISAPNQSIGTNTYTFASWSDGGAQTHTIVVPVAAQSYSANFTAAAVTPPAFVQVNAATPQTSQSSVGVTYTGAQTTGNTNIVAIGWNDATSNITSVTDAAGNTYQLAVPTARGAGVSQAIYYAKNIKAAAAGTNTVTATFNAPTPYVDIRALEYSGLDPVNPFDVGASASGTGTSANSGTVTTTAPGLVFGAGTTSRSFTAAGTNFTTRIITTSDLDIAEDRIVTAAGPYSATAPLSATSAAWIMQVATFKAAVAPTGDTTAPTAAITAPTGTVLGTVTISANATDNVGVAGVQFQVDGNAIGAEDTTSPYSITFNTTTVANGTHTLTAAARDAAGNTATSAPVTVTVANAATQAPLAFVQVNAATPQTSQSSVGVTYTGAQTTGNTNIVAIGWNDATSNITSVTDAAGNTYQLAVPTARGAGVSQAIYYAKNIKAAAAGTNTVTATFNAPTPYVDIRALEYSGLDPVNPFDVGASASGTGTSANSGTVTTTAPGLVFGAGTTSRSFTAAGTNFTTRIITTSDLDIAEDRFVTAAGPYSATAPLSATSAAWIMQVATFKAASGSIIV